MRELLRVQGGSGVVVDKTRRTKFDDIAVSQGQRLGDEIPVEIGAIGAAQICQYESVASPA
jgi:hypothetical protein